MDYLFLNTIAFPVRRCVLFRGRKTLGDYGWELEVYCDESPQLADLEAADDLLAGAARVPVPAYARARPAGLGHRPRLAVLLSVCVGGVPNRTIAGGFHRQAGRAVSGRDRRRLRQQRRVVRAAGSGMAGVAGVRSRTRQYLTRPARRRFVVQRSQMGRELCR